MWTSSFIGTSTHANEPEVIKATVDAGIWDVVLTSYNFVQEHREDVKKAIAYAVSKGVGVVAMNARETAAIRYGQSLKGILYCQNCRSCVSTCRESVSVPDLIRAYMYKEGYRNPIQARQTIAELPAGKGLDACTECSTCTAVCRNGIDIPDRVRTLIADNMHWG
ncbi:MAG: hypothetical protein KKD56_11615 [Acidobacteria bacterium]|nr:hypothetical protein [Acidobacteriota bacterium]MBU1474363.1 hypothetical protein [Acidobacteriota bacterium]MBU2437788.1 hypothetical protein [Acidobacteriota bacterium]